MKKYLGIEFGSTRIKGVLIDGDHQIIASGSFTWENQLVHGVWTYSLEDAKAGLRHCYRELKADYESKYKEKLTHIDAIGISGMDGHLIEAVCKDPKLGYVGKITKVNIAPVIDLLEKGYVPVISTLGCGEDGHPYNINGDTAAAYVAGALHAERLIMLTDIAGLLKDKDDPSTLIPEISASKAKELLIDGTISGGMIPKIECCITAIDAGVKKVIIMDGRIPHSILMELLTDEGAGTMITGDEQ